MFSDLKEKGKERGREGQRVEREREEGIQGGKHRERDRQTDRHWSATSCMRPNQESNPQLPGTWDDAPTNWVTWPGLKPRIETTVGTLTYCDHSLYCHLHWSMVPSSITSSSEKWEVAAKPSPNPVPPASLNAEVAQFCGTDEDWG